MPLPNVGWHAGFDRYLWNGKSLQRSSGKIGPLIYCLSRSRKESPSCTYDFLSLTIVNIGLSLIVSEIISNFGRKNANVSYHPCIYCPHWESYHWNFVTSVVLKKTRMMDLPGNKQIITICTTILTQHEHCRDGQKFYINVVLSACWCVIIKITFTILFGLLLNFFF